MANFKNRSIHNVECIARIIGKTEKGYMVEFQTNEAIYSNEELENDKGQETPYLVYRKQYANENGYVRDADKCNSVILTKKQFENLKEVAWNNYFIGEKNGHYIKEGQTYIAFRADINVAVKQYARNKNGNVIRKNGKPVLEIIGRMPNPKTFKRSNLRYFNESVFFEHLNNVARTNELADLKRNIRFTEM